MCSPKYLQEQRIGMAGMANVICLWLAVFFVTFVSTSARYPGTERFSSQSKDLAKVGGSGEIDHLFLESYSTESLDTTTKKEDWRWGRRENSAGRELLQQTSDSASCPLLFSGLTEFPFFVNTCQKPENFSKSASCCKALLSAIGLGEADYLRRHGFFRLPDNATVGACMEDLKGQLESDGLRDSRIVDVCIPPDDYHRFVSSPAKCAGIETTGDFYNLIGPSGNDTLSTTCSGDLLNLDRCLTCVDAMTKVTVSLITLAPNDGDCLYYTLWYAAGIINEFGPWEPGTAECIMAVGLVPDSSSNKIGLYAGIAAAAAAAACIVIWGSFFFWKRRKEKEQRAMIRQNKMMRTNLKPNTGLIIYNYEEMKTATKNFSAKNFIGSGGFGDVFKGELEDGMEIAVKRMKNCTVDGDNEFVNEVEVMNSVRHRNLVSLRGCCVSSNNADGPQRLLIYDYLPNGSLHDYLFGSEGRQALGWPERRRLSIGVAKGICYLHNDTRPPIIHRDIKPSNILLDEKLNAKVSDFGVAKFKVDGQSHMTTAVAGTRGYLAPEYALYGQLSVKSDVYSFGVVLLELMSGRPALCETKYGLMQITDWAWSMVKNGNIHEIVEASIRNSGPQDAMERFILVGILCSHLLVACRPTMQEALDYLEGNLPVPEIPDRPLPVNSPMPVSVSLDSSKLFPHLRAASSSSEFSGPLAPVSAHSLLR